MKVYDVPNCEGLSPEDAGRFLRMFRAAVLADPEHPFNRSDHPQHLDATKLFEALNDIVQQSEAAAATAAKIADLENALGDDVNLSPAECWARAKRLIATPGYLIPEPGAPRMLDEAREKLRRKINALQDYAARVEGQERANAEAERAGADDADAVDDDADAGGDDDAGGEAW